MIQGARFSGRVAVVTGGAAGIGHAAAERYAAEGATVVITDSNGEALGRATAELGVEGIQADLSSEADVERMVDDVVSRHGRADILVNLTAIYPFASIEHETLAEWRKVLATNLDSTFLCCQKVLPHMRRAGFGRIVNASSNTVAHAQPSMGAFVTTKAGIVGFTKVLAKEVGPRGITANVVMTGLIATRHALSLFGDAAVNDAFFADVVSHQAIKRRGEPEDVAEAILFLTSDAAGFITGQALQVDGGWSVELERLRVA